MAVDDVTRAGAAGRQDPPQDSPGDQPRGSDPEALVQRVQELTVGLGEIANSGDRLRAEELVSAVIELYGEGLERIFGALEEAGDGAAAIRNRLAEDGVVASLMLIHGLFPVDLRTRVSEALDSVRPYMESHGGDVELIALDQGVARIRLEGSCEGCPASASTLELAIKQALDEAAPDLEGLVVEGAIASPSPIGEAATELPMVQVAPGRAAAQPAWFQLDELEGVGEGELAEAEIEGVRLIVARIEGSLLAYRDACPGCKGSLLGGELTEGVLACPSCERRYYLPRAGRVLGGERLQLEPVPLLQSAGGVKVALAA
jgi:Fe-S cluster biogenesis protein NfuA/nitrite reductase/ring-hydroxylating ferredoxin subunit